MQRERDRQTEVKRGTHIQRRVERREESDRDRGKQGYKYKEMFSFDFAGFIPSTQCIYTPPLRY